MAAKGRFCVPDMGTVQSKPVHGEGEEMCLFLQQSMLFSVSRSVSQREHPSELRCTRRSVDTEAAPVSPTMMAFADLVTHYNFRGQ